MHAGKMNAENRIESFVSVGARLGRYEDDPVLSEAVRLAGVENPWYTPGFLDHALKAWANVLTRQNLTEWLASYQGRVGESNPPRTIAVVMAGNIPMVGFHDMLCVLISGNRLKAKLSSQDQHLLPAIGSLLEQVDPEWREYISFSKGPLSDFDAVIATGSDNTSRYFDYYFGKYPHIIRKNRNSVAILTGQETAGELADLADDVFLYFGRGCRNVSKIFLPQDYDPGNLQEAFNKYIDLFHHNKYRNNLDYQKSICLLNNIPYYDGGFFLMVPSASAASPVSVIHYEYYTEISSVFTWIEREKERLQCVVNTGKAFSGALEPGLTQHPGLADYADGADTLIFLTEKINNH